jgi:uncharacterized membrane protein
MFRHYTAPHIANLVVHIAAGTLALGLGLIALLSRKGGPLHTRAGRLFLYAYSVVVATAAIGILVFDFRSFLAVVTILSLYDVFAGYRALKLRGRHPRLIDNAVATLGLLAPLIFIASMHYLRKPWSPILTWSILSGLITISLYDLLRNVMASSWLARTWIQEHLVKMIGAYIAITSAFAATVFPQLMPWSAIVPSALGLITARGFIVIRFKIPPVSPANYTPTSFLD